MVIDRVRKKAESVRLDPDVIQGIYEDFVMEKNKHIQRLHNSTNGNGFKEIEKTITMATDMVDRIKRRFEVKKEILEEQNPGERYHVVSGTKEVEGRPVYEIKLLKE